MSKANPDTVKTIMEIVNGWESTDKTAFIEDILTHYVDEFVAESIRHDLEKGKRQKEQDDFKGWIFIEWEDDEDNRHSRGAKVLSYSDDNIQFVDPWCEIFNIQRSWVVGMNTDITDDVVAKWDAEHKANMQKSR